MVEMTAEESIPDRISRTSLGRMWKMLLARGVLFKLSMPSHPSCVRDISQLHIDRFSSKIYMSKLRNSRSHARPVLPSGLSAEGTSSCLSSVHARAPLWMWVQSSRVERQRRTTSVWLLSTTNLLVSHLGSQSPCELSQVSY